MEGSAMTTVIEAASLPGRRPEALKGGQKFVRHLFPDLSYFFDILLGGFQRLPIGNKAFPLRREPIPNSRFNFRDALPQGEEDKLLDTRDGHGGADTRRREIVCPCGIFGAPAEFVIE